MKACALFLLTLLGGLVAASAGETAEHAPASSTAPAPPASVAIPVAEVATRAAEVPNLLRALTAPLAQSAEVETIRNQLPDLRRRIDTDTAAVVGILRRQPTLDVLQAQQQLWQRRQLETTEWLAALTNRAALLEQSLDRLADIRRRWRETRDAAVVSKAPDPILKQIDGALTTIEAARTPLETQRTAVLDLQSVVAREVARSGEALAQFTTAQQLAMASMLARDSTPIWNAEAWSEARTTLRAHISGAVAAHRADVLSYLRDPSKGMPLHAGICVVLAVALLAARRRVRGWATTPEGASAAMSIFVPNAQLVTDRVTNWTLSDRTRRIDLPVGVDYGSAPEHVVEVLEAVARAHPEVLKTPAPQAVFIAFGDSSINFELRAWTNRFERWPKIQTELAGGVYAALHRAGMKFPFPQREVRVLRDATDGPAAVLPFEAATGPGRSPSDTGRP